MSRINMKQVRDIYDGKPRPVFVKKEKKKRIRVSIKKHFDPAPWLLEAIIASDYTCDSFAKAAGVEQLTLLHYMEGHHYQQPRTRLLIEDAVRNLLAEYLKED